jgi:hypothetical protein
VGISFPYDRSKRYLDGIDWTIAALDALNKRHTQCGNVSQLVLTLSGDIDEQRVRDRLHTIAADIRFLSGTTKRDLNLAPYWHAPRSHADAIAFVVVGVSNEQEATAALAGAVNSPFDHSRQHVRFTLVRGGDAVYLAMQFDHCLLDAKGAEMLLALIVSEASIDASALCIPQHPYLDRWRKCFEAGRDVNRFLRAVYAVPSVAVLAKHREPCSVENGFSMHTFTAKESESIERIAFETAGYLMIMPYLMAVTLRAFYAVYAGDGTAIVSLNTDTRGRTAGSETIFFNRLSFYHLKADRADAADVKRLAAMLRMQWYEQTKHGLPAKLALASSLTRIAPLGLTSRGVEAGLMKNPISFAFSYIADSRADARQAFGVNVTDLRHMPIVPFFPGVGVFFTKSHGRLHLVVSYCPDRVIPSVAERFASVIVDTLSGAL